MLPPIPIQAFDSCLPLPDSLHRCFHFLHAFVCLEEAIKAAVSEAVFKIGKNACMKNQWIAFDKASKLFSRKVHCLLAER